MIPSPEGWITNWKCSRFMTRMNRLRIVSIQEKNVNRKPKRAYCNRNILVIPSIDRAMLAVSLPDNPELGI